MKNMRNIITKMEGNIVFFVTVATTTTTRSLLFRPIWPLFKSNQQTIPCHSSY
ncbi:hypothetical protein HanPSC8_Chr01g0019581 [Helianthus annuus]|nr:hypothetical protein HanPSC8_Chr01g0019581 [Helianthus annuus]